MTHFTALQLGHALIKMFKLGQKKTLYEVSNFIKRNPDTVIQKVISYIKKQPETQPQQESKPKSELHENIGGYKPVLTDFQKIELQNVSKHLDDDSIRKKIEEMKNINEWIHTRNAKLLQIKQETPYYVKKCYPKLDNAIERFTKMSHDTPTSTQVFFQNQELQQLCSEIIMERNSEVKSHISNLAKMKRNYLEELSLSLRQMQSRMGFIEKQWEEYSQQQVSLLELSSSIQRKNELICQAYIKRRDIELSENNGIILIDKIYELFDQRVQSVQNAVKQLTNTVLNLNKGNIGILDDFDPFNYNEDY